MRKDLLERYLSTGRVGLTKPKNDEEAIDLIETVVELYDEKPTTMSLSEVSNKLKDLLNFWNFSLTFSKIFIKIYDRSKKMPIGEKENGFKRVYCKRKINY